MYSSPALVFLLIYLPCFSDHSCTDVTISGSTPIDQFDINGQNSQWPFASMPMHYYGREVGAWKNGWLVDVPSNFTTDYNVLKC